MWDKLAQFYTVSYKKVIRYWNTYIKYFTRLTRMASGLLSGGELMPIHTRFQMGESFGKYNGLCIEEVLGGL